MSELVSTV